jgi:hypothetical protein
MDGLSLFGLAAVTAMLIFWALEDRSPWFILAFAGACAWDRTMDSYRARGPLA